MTTKTCKCYITKAVDNRCVNCGLPIVRRPHDRT